MPMSRAMRNCWLRDRPPTCSGEMPRPGILVMRNQTVNPSAASGEEEGISPRPRTTGDQAGKCARCREQLQRDAFVLDLRAAAADARACLARDLEHRAVTEIVHAAPDTFADEPRRRKIGDVEKIIVGNVHRGRATAPRFDEGDGRAQTEACATPSFASSAAAAAS